MKPTIDVIGAGLAGSEAALQLANRGYAVRLFEMRPFRSTEVHMGANCAELVCSNSLKSLKPESAAGMLKHELTALGSEVLACAYEARVAAGGALAVNREVFSFLVTEKIMRHAAIDYHVGEVVSIDANGSLRVLTDETNEEGCRFAPAQAVVIATGPLTSDRFAQALVHLTGSEQLAFYDAAAPIVLADSLNLHKVFSQSRYEADGAGDYLNAPFTKQEYDQFIDELIHAEVVIKKSFETKELFQACQPIEELARRGVDAPRFGPMKPVGLTDPATGKRPWAVVQLRAEDAYAQSYNLVGFQTNLTFPEQKRVFRMIPGFEQAEFARFGVMHRNTFINAPALLSPSLNLKRPSGISVPVFVAGQLGGTEGYCEAIASGLVSALGVASVFAERSFEPLPKTTALGSLLHYATSEETHDYQPMHVNFGIIEPLDHRIKNKQERYKAYAQRGASDLHQYMQRNSWLFQGA